MQTLFPVAGLTAAVGAQAFPVESWHQVSSAYRRLIERLDLGASQAPPCVIRDASGAPIAHVSYNGKIWPGSPAHWRPGATPIFTP